MIKIGEDGKYRVFCDICGIKEITEMDNVWNNNFPNGKTYKEEMINGKIQYIPSRIDVCFKCLIKDDSKYINLAYELQKKYEKDVAKLIDEWKKVAKS